MTFREQCIHIIQRTFEGNPAVDFTIGTGWPLRFKKKRLAAFMFDYCHRRNGVYLSENGKGIICFYRHSTPVFPLYTFFDELCVGALAIGPFRLKKVVERSREVKRHHKKHSDFIHCWYLGVLKEYRDMSTALELKKLLIAQSNRSGLPVLAETTILQNKRVYERIGFKTYATIEIKGVTTYMLSYSE